MRIPPRPPMGPPLPQRPGAESPKPSPGTKPRPSAPAPGPKPKPRPQSGTENSGPHESQIPVRPPGQGGGED